MTTQENNLAGKRPVQIVLTQVMGPSHANTMGNVHGGIIMKLCDEAGGMAAAKYAQRPVVTVTVDSMSFMSPVNIGNLITVAATVTWVGRTSIETQVKVMAENVVTGEVTHTNQAYYVYVALDSDGRPTPVPPLICETDEEKQRFQRAEARRALRLKLKEGGG